MTEVSVHDEQDTEGEAVTEGYFEEEIYVDAETAGAFLVELGQKIQESDEITIRGGDWKIPFAFREPLELDIEFEGSQPELEIEVEMTGRLETDEAPDVE